jgi:hypothetical protein
MPEAGTTSALTTVAGEYQLEISDYDAAGKKTALVVGVPTNGDFKTWSLMQQVAMLKKGPWQKSPISEIMFGIAYAHSLGLDVMRGDIFPTGEGRLGISNKAKIKLALETGNIQGIETRFNQLNESINLPGCVLKNDLECTVTIHVKGWKAPIKRTAKLSRWFKAKNPNWLGNPEHMLELNTVAHACEFVNPTATEDDEAPPAIQSGSVQPIAIQSVVEAK